MKPYALNDWFRIRIVYGETAPANLREAMALQCKEAAAAVTRFLDGEPWIRRLETHQVRVEFDLTDDEVPLTVKFRKSKDDGILIFAPLCWKRFELLEHSEFAWIYLEQTLKILRSPQVVQRLGAVQLIPSFAPYASEDERFAVEAPDMAAAVIQRFTSQALADGPIAIDRVRSLLAAAGTKGVAADLAIDGLRQVAAQAGSAAEAARVALGSLGVAVPDARSGIDLIPAEHLLPASHTVDLDSILESEVGTNELLLVRPLDSSAESASDVILRYEQDLERILATLNATLEDSSLMSSFVYWVLSLAGDKSGP